MSGTFPTSPAPSNVNISSVAPAFASVGHDLTQQTRSRGAQRWGFEVEYSVSLRAEIGSIVGFLAAQKGRFEKFNFSPPCWYSQGTWAGFPATDTGPHTGTSVPLTGFTPGATVKAGDWLQFAGNAKVYMVKSDVTADLSGALTVELNTPLIVDPGTAATVSTHTRASPLVFVVSLTDDAFGFDGQFDTVYELTVLLQENV